MADSLDTVTKSPVIIRRSSASSSRIPRGKPADNDGVSNTYGSAKKSLKFDPSDCSALSDRDMLPIDLDQPVGRAKPSTFITESDLPASDDDSEEAILNAIHAKRFAELDGDGNFNDDDDRYSAMAEGIVEIDVESSDDATPVNAYLDSVLRTMIDELDDLDYNNSVLDDLNSELGDGEDEWTENDDARDEDNLADDIDDDDRNEYSDWGDKTDSFFQTYRENEEMSDEDVNQITLKLSRKEKDALVSKQYADSGAHTSSWKNRKFASQHQGYCGPEYDKTAWLDEEERDEQDLYPKRKSLTRFEEIAKIAHIAEDNAIGGTWFALFRIEESATA